MSALGDLLWVVSNARNPRADFEAQVTESLDLLDSALQEGGSDRTRMLSVQVLLQDMETKDAFDARWREWLGPDPAAWPQRACYQAGLSGGLLVEMIVVAARR
jgi:enamine deaminase RidA (YjgF/YER057c/UK114 family)